MSYPGGLVVDIRHSECDVYIGRASMEKPGTKWENRHVIGNCSICNKTHDRLEMIQEYKKDLLRNPELVTSLHELRGKVLGCFCKPRACHGDVLRSLANGPMGTRRPFYRVEAKCPDCGGRCDGNGMATWCVESCGRVEVHIEKITNQILAQKPMRV